ncbi:MAG TPA: hypothetical protein VM913_04730 [Sphingomicrobium sp.]|nr:hypothetical protein [Sphingomicrobium sp.]
MKSQLLTRSQAAEYLGVLPAFKVAEFAQFECLIQQCPPGLSEQIIGLLHPNPKKL